MAAVEKDSNCPFCPGKGEFTEEKRMKFIRTSGPQSSMTKHYECKTCSQVYWKFSKKIVVKNVSRETIVVGS